MATNQRINGQRLWDSLMDMAQIGATPKGGVKRLALGDVDRQGRDRFRTLCEGIGLQVRVDSIGNMFARRAGRDAVRLPEMFGSHLDSQPTGGKFDGALGVMAGLEVMRSIHDLGIETEAPLELVNWTDEEGSRFGHSLMGSGVWAGVYPEDKVNALEDVDGITVGQALDGIGYRGRIGLHQTMPVSSGLAERIVARASVGELEQCVAAEGMRNLRDAALARVRDGTTSIAEALTATPAA